MKITYMGTAAAEGIPGIFCDCEVCRKALARGGRNIMTRSQALVDDEFLIDFAADTYMHFLRERRTLSAVRYLFVTHAHSDHVTSDELQRRLDGYAYGRKYDKLEMYASEYVFRLLSDMAAVRRSPVTDQLPEHYRYIALKPFEPVQAGAYTVTPLPACHSAPPDRAFLFLIEREGRALFYGNDTGVFGEEVDDYLAAQGKKIDLLSLDCTKGDREQAYGTHMSMSEGRGIADRFARRGVLREGARLIYTHFSHNCGMVYDELKEAAAKYGFEVAYDGMTAEI